MRHLSKPEPPENVRHDNQEPQRFVDAEREYLETLPNKQNQTEFAKSEFDQLDKSKLREVMSGEQASLCVYCERRILEKQGDAHIEHWRPRSGEPRYAFHWKNLYLSCETRCTCGKAKGGRRLKWDDTDPDLPWPTDLEYERQVGFSRDGRIYVRSDADIDETTRKALNLAIDDHRDVEGTEKDGILNLNHPDLIAGRAAAINSERESMKRDFRNGIATRGEREERANRLLAKDPRPEFVSIRVATVLEKLGRGR